MNHSSISLLNPDPDKLWEDPSARSVSFFCKSLPVRIDNELINELKTVSEQRGGCNARICLHEDPGALHHDMIILEYRDQYSRPHKHINTGETFNIIEGELAVFIFNDNGDVAEVCHLQCGDVYRMNTGIFHVLLPVTDKVIYHETKAGPFDRDNNVPADWAPDGSDMKHQEQFMQSLQKYLNH